MFSCAGAIALQDLRELLPGRSMSIRLLRALFAGRPLEEAL